MAKTVDRTVWWRRLAFQIVAFLSIALLPIGLISVIQTRKVSTEAEVRATQAVLALTEQAAFEQQSLIEQARGAAQALSAYGNDEFFDRTTCSVRIRRYAEVEARYKFLAFVPESGVSTCSSDNQRRDFSGFSGTADLFEKASGTIKLFEGLYSEDASDLIVAHPLRHGGDEQMGYVAIAVPFIDLSENLTFLNSPGLVGLVTLTAEGRFLSASPGQAALREEMPNAKTIADLARKNRGLRYAPNQFGEARAYAMSSIIRDEVIIVGIWEAEILQAGVRGSILAPALFPALMWIASLFVAFLAVDRLVVRHIRSLGATMSNFARTRALPNDSATAEMPTELRGIRDDFLRMASDILQDEAALEDAVRGRNVLLKEVHHRVKNNLQLIASIMNIQARASKSDETRAVVGRLQDRVLSLATIHRDLYQSQSMGKVNSGNLIREVVENIVDLASGVNDGIDLDVDVDDISLYPDQAVPVSLLVSEAISNATKYLGADQSGKRWIRVGLKHSDERAELIIANSVGQESVAADGTGMGGVLIKAFVVQIGGTQEILESEGSYSLKIEFTVAQFVAVPEDY